MKAPQKRAHEGKNMTKSSTLEHKLLLGVASLAMLMSSTTAFAQDTDIIEEEEDVVIATGIKSSIQASLDLKRNANGIVEAITAEDIGKLPDISIADSLARLPGVTAQRVRGRAQQISIRGLGPDFSLALLNGREVVSAGSNRGIEFDQFPSELIAQGVVYKTPEARLAAFGIAGSVDLRTVRPLDYTDKQLAASARYVINDNGSLNPDFGSDGYRLFGSYIDQNEDGTFGWSLGVTHESNPTQFFSRELKTQPGQVEQTAGGSYFPKDNPRTGVVSRDFQRTSIAGTLEFEPNERFHATIDGFYSDFEDAGIFRGVETPLADWAGVSLPPATTGTGDFVDTATYTDATGVGIGQILRSDQESNNVELFAFGGNFDFQLSDVTSFTLDVSHSTLKRQDIDYESYAGTGRGIFGSGDPNTTEPFTFTFPSNGEYSISTPRDYTDPTQVGLTDPGGWGQVGFINEPNFNDDLTQIRAEVEREVDLPFVNSIIGGYFYTNRKKDFVNNRAFLRPGVGFVNGFLAIDPSAIIGSTDSGSIGLDIIAYDTDALVQNGTYAIQNTNGPNFDIQEDVQTVYGQLMLGSDDARLNGSLGIQYVYTDQGSTGTIGQLAGAQSLQTISDSYDHWLPTFNLSYELSDDVVLRGAVGQSITRARLDDLNANINVNRDLDVCPDGNGDNLPDAFDGNIFNPPGRVCLNYDGGNPVLRPFEATNFDASAEWYFSDAGALSVAVFHKELDEYVQRFRTVTNIATAAIDPDNQLPAGFTAANPNAAFYGADVPVNAGEGSLTGFEVALRLPLDDVIDMPIEGFGFNGNYTYTDAKAEFIDTNGNLNDIDIPGYSEQTASAELYYENNGWRGRVNTSYRSGYRAEVVQFDATLVGAQAKSRVTVDGQVGYEFQSGKLEGLAILFEAYNLTDEPFQTENDLDGDGPGTATYTNRREDYGRTFNFTVAKKF